MPAPKEARSAPRGGAQVVVDDRPPDDLCTCCEPRNPLVMRPDLGTLGDGSAEFALCVLHEPEPTVYRNRGDGVYLQAPRLALSPAGEIIDSTTGAVIARVAGEGFQRLSTVDDDEPPPGRDPGGAEASPSQDRASRPHTVHVDLSQDDFYGSRPLRALSGALERPFAPHHTLPLRGKPRARGAARVDWARP